MAEATWHESRLLVTAGINGGERRECRSTSALLAVLSSVKECGRSLVESFGASFGTIEGFAEVPLMLVARRRYARPARQIAWLVEPLGFSATSDLKEVTDGYAR